MAATAFHKGLWYLLLFWPAANFLTLSAGYAGFGAKVIGKAPSGKIPFRVKVFYSPYLAGYRLICRMRKVLLTENPFDQVTTDLFIGRRLQITELPDGIRNYVDLTAELEDPLKIRNEYNYISLPILDGSVPSEESLRSAITQLSEGRTYVHCAVGHGRTCLFALALLAEQGVDSSFDSGYALLSQARPKISLNREQRIFITQYLSKREMIMRSALLFEVNE